MNNREFKKWKPFNSVVSSKELINKETSIEYPALSKDEIAEFEELLKESFYLKKKLTIIYVENGTKNEITDYVLALDPLRKNISLRNKTINFRQILKIKSNK